MKSELVFIANLVPPSLFGSPQVCLQLNLPAGESHSFTALPRTMASKAGRLIRQSYNASTTPSYIERLCTSWLLPPLALFAYRVLISLYAFILLFFRIGWDTTHGETRQAGQSFSYLTILSYWGLAFYFAFAAAHTASYAFRGRAWLDSWPGPLKWLHSTFYATITVYPWIVTGMILVKIRQR